MFSGWLWTESSQPPSSPRSWPRPHGHGSALPCRKTGSAKTRRRRSPRRSSPGWIDPRLLWTSSPYRCRCEVMQPIRDLAELARHGGSVHAQCRTCGRTAIFSVFELLAFFRQRHWPIAWPRFAERLRCEGCDARGPRVSWRTDPPPPEDPMPPRPRYARQPRPAPLNEGEDGLARARERRRRARAA